MKKSLTSRLYMVLLVLFLYLPILTLVIFSFNAKDSRVAWGGFSLRWYVALFSDRTTMLALFNTLLVAIVSSVISTALGTTAAIGINNLNKKARSLVMNITYIPIVNPEIIMGVSLMLLFKVFMRHTPLEFGYITLVLAHIAFCVPYVIFQVLPKLRQMNPNLLEAAYDLGCNSRQAFFKVVIPEILPGVFSGFIMALTYSLDDFVVSYFNSGEGVLTLPIVINSMTRRNMDPSINALSTLIFVTILIVLVVKNFIDNRKLRVEQKEKEGLRSRKKTIALITALVLLFSSVGVTVGIVLNMGPKLEMDMRMLSNYDYTRFANDKLTINVANWGEYLCIDEADMINVNEQFEALTGIKVNYTTYTNNEELYAKLKSGGANYDIVIPSDYMISRFINEGMIQKLDYENIPNFDTKIMDTFKNLSYDPTNEYTVPYTWGMVCIIYNKTMYDKAPDSWGALWDEAQKGNILMFNNPRDAFAAAQCYMGYSLNTTDKNEIDKTFEKLYEQYSSDLVQAYVMDEVFDKMEGGNAAVAPYYVGDAVSMLESNPDLDYYIPKEGTNRFVDAACIPTGAKNKEAAEMYINFLCETEIALANCEYIGYSTPHKEVFELLDDEVKNDERRYPSDEFLNEKTELYIALPEETNNYIQSLWNQIKFSN